MTFIWLSIVILLSIVELMTTNLTTIWFVISGLVSLILSFTKLGFYVQFGVFTILGVILLLTTRTWLQSKILSSSEKTNLDRIIGMTGIVTEDISDNNPGEVKVDGKKWTAISKAEIKEKEKVHILAIDGVKLIVEKEAE